MDSFRERKIMHINSTWHTLLQPANVQLISRKKTGIFYFSTTYKHNLREKNFIVILLQAELIRIQILGKWRHNCSLFHLNDVCWHFITFSQHLNLLLNIIQDLVFFEKIIADSGNPTEISESANYYEPTKREDVVKSLEIWTRKKLN